MFFEKLKDLSKKRIDYFIKKGDQTGWYKGSNTYFESLLDEIQEAKNELNTNQIYLEDELGDVLWDFLCLLNSLKAEGKISSVEKVIERAWEKFSGRIDTQTGGYKGDWEKIKKHQKKLLLLESKRTNF